MALSLKSKTFLKPSKLKPLKDKMKSTFKSLNSKKSKKELPNQFVLKLKPKHPLVTKIRFPDLRKKLRKCKLTTKNFKITTARKIKMIQRISLFWNTK